MTNTLKIATVAALMIAGIASPAFAQSADHTGSQMASYYDATGKQMWGTWGPSATTVRSRHAATQRNGLNAFAAVPGGLSGSLSPRDTGGGSIGYNESLRKDQW
jgi:hypothetical protein